MFSDSSFFGKEATENRLHTLQTKTGLQLGSTVKLHTELKRNWESLPFIIKNNIKKVSTTATICATVAPLPVSAHFQLSDIRPTCHPRRAAVGDVGSVEDHTQVGLRWCRTPFCRLCVGKYLCKMTQTWRHKHNFLV